MTRYAGETWLFRVRLPDGLPNPGRYVAAILKHLDRVWGVKTTAVLEAPPEEPPPVNGPDEARNAAR